MKIKVEKITEKITEFIDSCSEETLGQESIVLTNGIWNIYLDYQGNNPKNALNDLKIMANYKKDLIHKMVVSESAHQILAVAVDFEEFFRYRDFIVSVGSRNNILRGLSLRLRSWWMGLGI